MKNIMIVDGCQEYGFDIHQIGEPHFREIMPASEENVVFIEDIYNRSDYNELFPAFKAMWYGRIDNKNVKGIDGIFFYESYGRKIGYADRSANCKKRGTKEPNILQNPSHRCIIVLYKDPTKKICPHIVDQSVFSSIFPGREQDVAFYEDFDYGPKESKTIIEDNITPSNHIYMEDVSSIDGIIYIGYPEWRSKYLLRRDSEIERHYPLAEHDRPMT